MKKGFVHAALCALTLAAPATAERFYVPVLGTTAADGTALATKVWVANADGVEQPVAAQFREALRGDVVGDERVAAGAGGQLLTDLAPAEKAGLIVLEADPDLSISAWTVGRGAKAVAEVPVFVDREVYEAHMDVSLGDMPRGRAAASLLVGAANLSEQTAFCSATLYDRNGGRLSEVPFEVAPMSLAREKVAGRAAEVRVTCNQSFYPFAVAADKSGLQPTFATGIGPNGPCDYTQTLVKQLNGDYYLEQLGPFHLGSRANPKGIICVKATQELRVAKAIYDWDVTVGPWSKRDKAGLHNMAYYFLDRYRSGIVGNVNAAGPNKSIVKFMQNLGMAKGTNTNAKVGLELAQGQTYHFTYTFDAANKLATLQVFNNSGVELQEVQQGYQARQQPDAGHPAVRQGRPGGVGPRPRVRQQQRPAHARGGELRLYVPQLQGQVHPEEVGGVSAPVLRGAAAASRGPLLFGGHTSLGPIRLLLILLSFFLFFDEFLQLVKGGLEVVLQGGFDAGAHLLGVLDLFEQVCLGVGRQGLGDLPDFRPEGDHLGGDLPDPLPIGGRQILGDLQQAVAEAESVANGLPELVQQGEILRGHPG